MIAMQEHHRETTPHAIDQPSYLQIDGDAIESNLAELRRRIRVPIMAVVKNNGYGLGLVPYAKFLTRLGLSHFGVSHESEAIMLREALPEARIFLLTPVLSLEKLVALIENDIVISIGSEACLDILRLAEKRTGKRACIQIELDTGFGRYGFLPDQMEILLQTAQRFEIDGVFTHFAEPYGDEKFTRKQFNLFQKTVAHLKKYGVPTGNLHCCATGAALLYPDMHLDMVRIGSGLIGAVPSPKQYALRSAARLKAEIVSVKELPAGWSLGYGSHYRLRQPKKVGIIHTGAIDGAMLTRCDPNMSFLRHAKRTLCALAPTLPQVEVNGQFTHILGSVGMNHLALDVDRIPCQVGDWASLSLNSSFCPAFIYRAFQYHGDLKEFQ